MFVLSQNQSQELLEEPETGMGYQRVEVELVNQDIKTGYVFNAELLRTDDEAPVKLDAIQYDRLMKTASRQVSVIHSIRLIAKEGLTRQATMTVGSDEATTRATVEDHENKSAANGAIEMTPGPEVFKRYTAYKNDRRIRADHSLLPGTYATTEVDARNVSTGTEAVERYALPDPTPAIYVFTIKPQPGTPLQRGIVQPAFGHAGGGEEVIFTHGTTRQTVTGPATIPA